MAERKTEAEVNGIERYFLEQKVARLHELRQAIAKKLGGPDAAMDISIWYKAAVEAGACPNCGEDFKNLPPEYNLYPHWMGGCKEVPRG